MRAFSVYNRRIQLRRTLWVLAVICHLISEGDSGNSQKTFNSSNAECKLSPDSSTSRKICLTPECTDSAADILLNLDENVDPCDDFYKFACGGWKNRHTIPDDEIKISYEGEAEEQLWIKFKALIEKKLTGSEPDYVRIIKDMYDSCMDIKSIRENFFKPLNELFDVFGGWPVKEEDDWKGNEMDWIDIFAFVRNRGYHYNYLLRHGPSWNLNKIVISLNKPSNIIVYEGGINDSKAIAKLEKMVEMAVELGADPTFARKEMLDAINFEISLVNFSLPENPVVYGDNNPYLEYSAEQLQNRIPQIDWKKYFKEILNDYLTYYNKTKVMAQVSYLIHYAGVLENTEKRVVNNYIMWRIADWYKRTFNRETQDVKRWKYCLGILKSSFADAVGSYLFNNSFEPGFRVRILELVLYQERELIDLFANNEWLDTDAKDHVMEKIPALNTNLGYLDDNKSDIEVSNKYKEIGIISGSFIDNYLRLSRILHNYHGFMFKIADKKLQLESFMNNSNTLFLAAGHLQHPFFSKERPQYLNFGALGTIIGYQILKCYGKTTFLMDKDGNRTEWKYKETAELFNKKIKCYEEQYQSHTTEDESEEETHRRVNHILALSEGLKITYKAYNTWVKNHGGEAQLPGLKYTPKQLFWIYFANTKCAKVYSRYFERREKLSPWDNVISPLSNQPEFANDFKCKDGSKMNPKKKCQLW